ncbi:hypothetical protein SNE40_014334 [Patella caerulea]|uniref:Uncharacterized protein n=1 Tax=Patella caerulea TaxID=87958 RepID=A0AAN8PCP8_PATCE
MPEIDSQPVRYHNSRFNGIEVDSTYCSDKLLQRSLDVKSMCKDSIYVKTISWLRHLKPFSKSRSYVCDFCPVSTSPNRWKTSALYEHKENHLRKCSTLPRDTKFLGNYF